jgi:hypothetical protein
MRMLLYVYIGVVLATAAYAKQWRDPPMLPDPNLTPGAVYADFGYKQACVEGTPEYRYVLTPSQKREVYGRYNVLPGQRYEIDRLVPATLGGTDAPENLWPQSLTTTPWDAAHKNALEVSLRIDVCLGKIDIKDAQRKIATNWVKAYCEYIKDRSEYCE